MRSTLRFVVVIAVELFLGSTATAWGQGARFGLQFSPNVPLGDLKDAVDSHVGVGVGAHVTFELASGSVLRPRLDYIYYPEAYDVVTLTNLSLGLDYLYFVGGSAEGLYLTVGVTGNCWTEKVSNDGSSSTTKFGYAGGLGYNFSDTFGMELRYTNTKLPHADFSASQLGFIFRF